MISETTVQFVRPDTGRLRVQTVNDLESKTVQADAVRADIREVLRKYEAMGIVDHLAKVDMTFRDVTEFEDFADLMRQSKEAEAAFMRLPSKLREVFGHDVARWLDAAHDPEKLESYRPKLEALGVLEPLPEADPAPAPAGTDAG